MRSLRGTIVQWLMKQLNQISQQKPDGAPSNS